MRIEGACELTNERDQKLHAQACYRFHSFVVLRSEHGLLSEEIGIGAHSTSGFKNPVEVHCQMVFSGVANQRV